MTRKYDLEGSMSDRVEFDRVQEEYAYQMMNALSHNEAMAQDPDQYAEIGWEAFEIDMEVGSVEVDDLEEAKARFFAAFKEGVNRWKEWNGDGE